jgi:trimeric autotransporter adhesin
MCTRSTFKGWIIGPLLCLGAFGAARAQPTSIPQEPLVDPRGPSVQSFLVSGGFIDTDALRNSGYEGPLDFSGYDIRLDRAAGPSFEPLARALPRAGGDENWYGGFGHPEPVTGTDLPVYCLAVYDGDLVAGGAFTTAGGVPANSIARWDGQAWHALGRGFPGGRVLAMIVYNGDLIAGGEWSTWGKRHIARWDGTDWHGFGDGLENGTDADVSALAIYNGELIVGGWFSSVGNGIRASRIARWNGIGWGTLGSGVEAEPGKWSNIYGLVEHQGKLIAAGDFRMIGGVTTSCIASWDGTSWSGLGGGLSGVDPAYQHDPTMVRTVAVYDGKLFAGGWFTRAGDVAASCIASWDGVAWSPVGSGMNNLVRSLGVFDGNLYAGGWFSRAGGVYASCVAKWNGEAWSPLGSGMDDWVHDALLVRDGVLMVGGWFMEAGGVGVGHVARWDGAAWSALEQAPPGNGLNGNVYASVAVGGDLIVGGDFTRVDGIHASRVARWDGTAWSRYGTGMNRPVRAVCIYNGDLVAGGEFTTADGNDAWFIARWTGATWVPMGVGFDGPVRALAVYDGDLIAGGDFALAGATEVHHVARWDGASWGPLGLGIGSYDPFLKPTVFTLLAADGVLHAGGRFNLADGNAASFIARWDGTAWTPLGNGLSYTVRALATHDGSLIAGGDFWYADDQHSFGVARWDGSDWTAIGSEPFDGVQAIASYNGGLLLGFSGISSDEKLAYVANWDGTSWKPLGSGTDGPVRCLTVLGNHLYAGGDFSAAGGIASYHLARWTDPTAPVGPPSAGGQTGEDGEQAEGGTDPAENPGGEGPESDGPGTGGNPHGPGFDPTARDGFGLYLEVPNPYQPNQAIHVDPPSLLALDVAIFNTEGRRVCTLYSGTASGAVQTLAWDGLTEGVLAASGIYFVWARAGNVTARRTIVLWR